MFYDSCFADKSGVIFLTCNAIHDTFRFQPMKFLYTVYIHILMKLWFVHRTI